MGFHKQFFSILKRSAIDLSFYKEVIGKPFSFSLKYLFALILLVSFTHVIKITVVTLPIVLKVPQYIEKMKQDLLMAYPEELVLSIHKGELRTNVVEPYYIDIPQLIDKESFEHFITIDTVRSADDYPNLNTAVLITRSSIIYSDRNNGKHNHKVYSLRSLTSDVVIDKIWYDSMIGNIDPYLRYIPALLIIGSVLFLLLAPFFITTYTLIGKLLLLLVASIIFYVIAKAVKTGLGYKKVYQLSMHGVTLPILVEEIRNLLVESFIPVMCIGEHCSWISSLILFMRNYLFIAVLFLFMSLVIYEFMKDKILKRATNQ